METTFVPTLGAHFVQAPGQPVRYVLEAHMGMGLSAVQAALEPVQLVHVPDACPPQPLRYWYVLQVAAP